MKDFFHFWPSTNGFVKGVAQKHNSDTKRYEIIKSYKGSKQEGKSPGVCRQNNRHMKW